jgi:hypothetical protein
MFENITAEVAKCLSMLAQIQTSARGHVLRDVGWYDFGSLEGASLRYRRLVMVKWLLRDGVGFDTSCAAPGSVFS